ncbi:MAG: hypothetical protein AAFZ87_13655 [Planctomycetota bacterium]
MSAGALRVLRAEMVRLATSRTAWVGAAMALIVPILRVGASAVAERARRFEAAAEGREIGGLESGTGWAMLVDGWRAGLMLVTALLLVQSARTVAGDRESGVLRLATTRSASRTGAVVGRALMGPILVLGLVALTGLGAWCGAALLGGGDFGNLVEYGDELFGPEGVSLIVEDLQRALLIASLGLMSIHAFGIVVSSIVPGPVVALAVSLAGLVLWDVFKGSVGEANLFVFATHAPTFDDSSPMVEMAKISRGMSDGLVSDLAFRTGLLFPAAEGLLFVALACLAVRRARI